MHKHHRAGEVFENVEANKTRAAHSPNGKCTCRQRLCLSARAANVSTRKLCEKQLRKDQL